MNRLSLISITFLVLFISCTGNRPFDTEKWKHSADGTYPHRYAMIENILADSALLQMTEPEIIERLGPANGRGEDPPGIKTLHYLVQVAYGWDIDPLFYSSLILTLNSETGKLIILEFHESKDRRTLIEKLTTRKY